MPPEKTDVTDSESSTDNLDSSLSGKGDDASLKNPSKQSWENQAKEYQRKYTDLSDKYDTVMDEISDLREKVSSGDATREDRAELSKLSTRADAIKDAQDKILGNPEAKPWLGIIEETSTKKASQKVEDGIYEYDYRQALKSVKRMAREESVEEKVLQDELFEILKGGRWEFDSKGRRVMPTERIDNAMEEWHRMNKLKATAKKGEEKEAQFAEKAGRTMQRSPSKLEELKSAKESGRFSDILAKKAFTQQEHFK